MGCAQSKPQVAPNLSVAPAGPSLERRSTGRIYADALKAGSSEQKEYDCYLSCEATAASLAAEVRSSLEGHQLPAPTGGLKEKLSTLRASRKVVIFLTPAYFSDAGCCAEFCEAVAAGIEVLPVCVEGSTWSGMPFPQLTDVPETVETPVGTKAPRDAAGAVFGHTIAIEHKSAYLPAFVQKLRERLGQPSSSLSPKAGGRKLLKSAAAADSSYDAFLSHKRSESQDTVARVHDKLTDAGYRAFIDRNDLVELPQLKLAVRESSVLVFFLTPLIFQSAWCCLELCEAVEHDVPILFVIHDGAQWGGRPFPQLTDIPETMTVHAAEDIVLRPREAFAKAEKSAARLDHARSYFPDFVDKLKDNLGPPPAVAGLEGEAKSVWQAAGGGATINWGKLQAQLKAQGGPGYAAAESAVAKSLAVRNTGDASAKVSAATFAALFPAGTNLKDIVGILGGSGGSAGEQERLISVVQETDGGAPVDCGLALVGPNTSLNEVRTQVREANEDDEDEEEAEVTELSKLLAAGSFTFLLPDTKVPVRRKQEKLVKGKAAGDPVLLTTTKAKKANANEGEDAAATAASTNAEAARNVVARGARLDADALELDAVLRDSAATAALRRHAVARVIAAGAAAGQTATEVEQDALFASRMLALADALAAKDMGAALSAANDVSAFVAGDSSLSAAAAGKSPAEVAEALRPEAVRVHARLAPALEQMRAEMFAGAGGAALKGAAHNGKHGETKRVVILGGGPCGVTVLHQLQHMNAGFHVTVIDTKDFYEDTPNVVRLMCNPDCEDLWALSAFRFADLLRGEGEHIVGTAAAVRRDHVLVGTTAGVASRVVPFDYLVISTGTSYTSDIKTEGATIAHRKQAFEIERRRMAASSCFTVVGSGVVGTELAHDIKSFFPDKPVNVVTRSDVGFLPRVPGAHEIIGKHAEEAGLGLTKGKVIKKTNEDGQVVTMDGEVIGEKGARTYFATGYTPNTSYLKDPRTDPAITSLLDGGGFVGVRRSQQLKGDGLEHIFAGGDLCSVDAHSHGERTANMACLHAGAIVQNILLLAGRREGKLKQVLLNENPGLNILAVSLGKDNGLLYSCEPNMAAFFGSAEALKAEVGEMGPAGTAGKAGWKELSPAVNFIKFSSFPEGFKKMLFDDDMAVWGQFFAPLVQDMP